MASSSALPKLLFLSLLPFLPIINTQVASGTCWINSYFNDTCQCPPGFSFKDPTNHLGGCIQDFPTGCQVPDDETTNPEDLYELKEVQGLNFPSAGGYAGEVTNNQTECEQFLWISWACTVAIFNGKECLKMQLPLPNGRLEDGALSIIKVRKGSSTSAPPSVNSIYNSTCDTCTGFGSYCIPNINGTSPICQCPPGFSFNDPNNSSLGCKQDFPLGCRVPADETTKLEDFYELTEVQGLNFSSGDYESSETYNQTQCGQSCLHDLACTVAIFNGKTCWKKKMPLSNGILEDGALCIIKVRKGSTAPPSVGPVNPNSDSSGAPPLPGSGKKWQWIVIAVAIFLPVLFVGIFCYLRMRKRRPKAGKGIELPALKDDRTELKNFSLESIVEATNNFSEENKLGEGGFGPVYKGKLQGREIAAKRLSRASGQGLEELKNELILISKLQHRNLVQVLGSCIHGEEKMLIYEYMPNKSLDFYIFDPTKRELLDWKARLNIIDGIAQGLLYLHKYSRMRVIHRDLKASNVLLDENMNAKISDFGMARIFEQNVTKDITERVVGTRGYMAPEYVREKTISVKSDIFSFGVLILEIVSGRRNTSPYDFENRTLNLIGYAWELWKEGTTALDQLKDPTIRDSCAPNQFVRIIHVGLLCVQASATDRPTMVDVISMLSNETMALPAPKKPAFFIGRDVPDTTTKDHKSKDCSVNGLTISTMEARM